MDQRIWIPTIGDRIRLLSPWTFALTNEYRCLDLIEALDICGPGAPLAMDNVTLPAETVLKIDRIYIRGTARDYDSVTFRIHQCPQARNLTSRKFGGTGPRACRFFAKLRDVNRIVAEPVDAQQS